MKLRTLTIDDYPKLVPFWKRNYFVNEMDNIGRFRLFLEKNPKLSVLMEEDGKIIGTALVSFDGRRGYLQKVVTDKNSRKKGVGKQLVTEAIKRLKALGTLYIPISVEKDLIEFYEKCGFKTTEQVPMNIELG